MKIRTDFVTNSSSSSFSVLLTVCGTDGSFVTYEDIPNSMDGGEASFSSNLRTLSTPFIPELLQKVLGTEYRVSAENTAQEKRMKTVTIGEELDLIKEGPARNLRVGGWMDTYTIGAGKSTGMIGWMEGDMDSVASLMNVQGVTVKAIVCQKEEFDTCTVRLSVKSDESSSQNDVFKDVSELAKLLMNSVTNDYDRANTKKKQSFVTAVRKKYASVDQIETINVERHYSAWGEFADLIPENDRTLCVLAENIIMSNDDKRPKALQSMREYILASDPDRAMNFGAGIDDIRYACETDDASLLNLAKTLCRHEGPGSVDGDEYHEIALQNGESKSYAVFNLSPYTRCWNVNEVPVEKVRELVEKERREEEAKQKKEREAWFAMNGEHVTQNPEIVIPGHIFVLSEYYDVKDKYQTLVTERGGIIRTAVSGKTDYLVVEPCGTYPEYHIRDALIQRKKGKPVQIILAEDLEKALFKE